MNSTTRTFSRIFMIMAMLIIGGAIWLSGNTANALHNADTETVSGIYENTNEDFADLVQKEFYLPGSTTAETATPTVSTEAAPAVSILEQIYAPQCSIKAHGTPGSIAMNTQGCR